jgi:hypothetical protein
LRNDETLNKISAILNIFAILLSVYSLLWFLHGNVANGSYGIDFAIFVAVMASNLSTFVDPRTEREKKEETK